MTRVTRQDDELNLSASVKHQDDVWMISRMMARITNRTNQFQKKNYEPKIKPSSCFQGDGTLAQDESSKSSRIIHMHANTGSNNRQNVPTLTLFSFRCVNCIFFVEGVLDLAY